MDIELQEAHELCVCQRYNGPEECEGKYKVREQGKSVQLVPNSGEQTIVIMIDKCVISEDDIRKRTDCLFLYERRNKHYALLVELKGRHHIRTAFEQIKATLRHSEYLYIIEQLTNPVKKQFIISNTQLDRFKIRKLEDEFRIRVQDILYSDPQKPIPDLKYHL